MKSIGKFTFKIAAKADQISKCLEAFHQFQKLSSLVILLGTVD